MVPRRLFFVLFAAAVVVSACGTGGSEPPTIDFTRLEADGATVISEFVFDDDDGQVTVSVDWGDGSEPRTFVGKGSSAASHEYAPGTGEVVVTLTATDEDGQQVSTGRTITVDVAAADTTTSSSEPETATTSSTEPETTTTSSTTTSTTSSTTTTTTTTLPPEALEQVFEFDEDDAELTPRVDFGGGGAFGYVGRTRVEASTAGFDGGAFAEAALRWTIPAADLEPVLEPLIASGGELSFRVLIDFAFSATLRTGPNPGRAASFTVNSIGLQGTEDVGSAAGPIGDIENGDELVRPATSERIGFGAVVPAERKDLVVVLTASCLVQPGETVFQIGESSVCEVTVDPTVRVTVAPAS